TAAFSNNHAHILHSHLAPDIAEFLPDFAYPQWANDGDKPRAKDLANCTANSAFYLRFEGTSLNDTIYDNSTDAFLLNGGTTQTFTCAQALDPNNKATIDLSEGVPNDDVQCCNAFRYRSDIPISAEIDGVDLTLDINATYGENATLFMEYCEGSFGRALRTSKYTQVFNANRTNRPSLLPLVPFGTTNNPLDPDYAKNEMGASSAWILQVCYGAAESSFNFSNPEGYSISELRDVSEGMCETAEDLSARMNFEPATPEDCDAILQCLVDIATLSTAQDAPEPSTDDFSETKYDLCGGNATELAQKKEDVCSAGSSLSGLASYPIINGSGTGCRALPFCPEVFEPHFRSFSPGYPSGSPYEQLVPNPGNGFDNRTSTQLVDTFTKIKIPLELASIALEALSDGLPASWPYFFKVIPVLAIDSTVLVMETMLEFWALHNGLVNSAEIEATYENSRQMLDGSSAIYDEVVCRCSESYTLRGQGCDGKDNNCDQIVDDCVAIRDGSRRSKMPSIANAVVVGDDCDQAILNATPTVSGNCSEAEIALDASDACGNVAETKVVLVSIDLEGPTLSCSVGQGGSTMMRLIDTAGAGTMVDVNLQYEAIDNCGGEVNVTVTVFANEEEDFQKQGMGVFYKSSANNGKGGLYLASKSCWSDGMGTCIRDPSQDPNAFYRLYTVQVSAVDSSGREATPAECRVLVVPEERLNEDFDISKSTQRFTIAEYTSVSNPSPVLKYQLEDDGIVAPTPPTVPTAVETPINGIPEGKWFVAWEKYKCVKACTGGDSCGGAPSYYDELYDTPEECCAWISWLPREDCVQSNSLSKHYYVHWPSFKCVQNCEVGSGPHCGGAAASWNELHEYLPECCEKLHFVADENCLLDGTL
ncbi:hypothetical protein THAOC_20547, partial [Thalassiosira oceanica]